MASRTIPRIVHEPDRSLSRVREHCENVAWISYTFAMDLNIASEERSLFRMRLVECLRNSGLDASATALAREFNRRTHGGAITVHGARKWLTGSAFPTHERLVILARWLNVSPSWLRFGEDRGAVESAADDPDQLPLNQVLLINDFNLLDERSQAVVCDLVTSLLKHHALRG